MTYASAHRLTFRQHAGDPTALSQLLATEGAVRAGHFRLLSDQHTDCFIAFSAIAADPAALDLIASWLGPTVDAWVPDAVLAPSTAGVGLAATLARRLSAPLHLAASGPDGRPGCVVGTQITPGARVLLVNDVTTTGTSLAALARIVSSHSAVVAGAAWFVSRSMDAGSTLAFPSARIADLDLPAWSADTCRLCPVEQTGPEDAIDLN